MEYSTAPKLATARLRLRPYSYKDFEEFARLYSSSRSRYADGPVSRATAWKWFASGAGSWSLVGYGAWAVDRLNDGACVGIVSLNHPIKRAEEQELGWLLWEQFEGNGYAIEAAIEARRFAFAELRWRTLVSYIAKENSQSVRLVQRMGAKLDESATALVDAQTIVYRHLPSSSRMQDAIL